MEKNYPNLLNTGDAVFNEIRANTITGAKDTSFKVSRISDDIKTAMEPVRNTVMAMSIVFAFFDVLLSVALLWKGLKKGGALRPIGEHKLKISAALAKVLAAVTILGLGIFSLVFPPLLPIFGLLIAGVMLADLIYSSIASGLFQSIKKNKVAIVSILTISLALAAIIALSAIALANPVAAPALFLTAAVVGMALSIYVLAIGVFQFAKAKSKLNTLDHEIETLEKTPMLNPEQKKNLEALKSQRAQLAKQCNKTNIVDLGTKAGMAFGALLIVIGLALTVAFPPAGFAIAAVGAAVGTVSSFIKVASLVVEFIHNKQAQKLQAANKDNPPTRDDLSQAKVRDKKDNDKAPVITKSLFANIKKVVGANSKVPTARNVGRTI